MNNSLNRSTSVPLAVVAVLMGCGIAVRASDLSAGLRHGMSGVIALALVVAVYQLSRRR